MAETGSWRAVVRSRYWREEDAREVVGAWRRSGESRAQFCRAHGIAPARLSRWSARLGKAKAVPFHPVRVVGATPRTSEALVVELPGVATIRLAPGFAEEDLRRILNALEPEAC